MIGKEEEFRSCVIASAGDQRLDCLGSEQMRIVHPIMRSHHKCRKPEQKRLGSSIQVARRGIILWAGVMYVCLLVVAFLALMPGTALAGKGDRELGPGLSYDAYFNFELATKRNFDLERGEADGLITTEPELGLDLLFDAAPWLKLAVNLELSRLDRLENDRNKPEKGFELHIKELYFDVPDLFDRFTLRVGRQGYEDELEWLYDEELDAVRLFFQGGAYEAEVSVSQERLLDVDLLNDDKRNEITNYLAVVRRRINDDTHVDAYVMYRDEHRFRDRVPEDLLFLGIQSIGEIEDFEYWFNAAYVTGDWRGNDISGFGIDGGATYVFEHRLEPSVTLGVAFGSGDNAPRNGKDGNFRQTGLQDNSQKFNGVESFAYFGELVRPELSNMWIFTAGAGFRPSEKSSVDIVYHYYRQVEADDDLRDTKLKMDPNGLSKDLGHEIDLIIGYREIRDINIGLALGIFFPGKAFDDDASNAYFGSLEVSFAL